MTRQITICTTLLIVEPHTSQTQHFNLSRTNSIRKTHETDHSHMLYLYCASVVQSIYYPSKTHIQEQFTLTVAKLTGNKSICYDLYACSISCGVTILARRPAQLTTSQNMEMYMIDRLPTLRPFIQNHPESIGQAQVSSTLLANNH